MTRLASIVLLGTIVLGGCATNMHKPTSSTNDHDLFTETAGTGSRTIVFLPGLLGTTSYWKSAGLADLEPDNRLLFVDLLGFGRSPWPDIDYTLDVHVEALRSTLQAEGATRDVVLVAHSFGAIVASYYAARYPDEIEGLILFGAPVYESEAEARARVGRMSGLAGMLVNSRPLARVVCALHNVTIPITRRLAPGMRRDLPPAVASDATLHHWPSLDGSVRNVILTRPMSNALRQVKAPVTFVYGRRDDVSDPGSVNALASAIGASVVETDDDHSGYWKGAGAILSGVLARGTSTPTTTETP